MTRPRDMQRSVKLAAVALFVLALTAAALEDSSLAAAAAREGPAFHAFGEVVSLLGLSGYMLAASAATAVGATLLSRRAEWPDRAMRGRLVAGGALLVFASVAASGLLCQAIKHMVGRARPRFFGEWGAFHFDGPGFHPGFDSFPSGHATSVFAAAVALALLLPAWRVPFLALAVLVCAARVLAGAHYPSDTVAGAVLGGVVTMWLARGFAARGLAFRVLPGGPQPVGLAPHVAPERAAP